MLTIFTPTYNRAAMLPRLYNSLKCQSGMDFEWLIVDDGSSDDTKSAVDGFITEAKFPIRYYWKENGGKHTAHNFALDKAQGEWFFCVDSDDILAPNGLEMIAKAVEQIDGDKGIVAYKSDQLGNRLSDAFPDGYTYAKMNELTLIHQCKGEFSLVFPTSVAKEYPFPIFAGERFVTECVVYDRMDLVCPMYLLPQVVTICEYQTDGYSQNANAVMAKNPNGFCLYFMQRIDIVPSWVSRLVCAGKYWCFRLIAKNKDLRYRGKHRFLCALGLPVGLVFRIYYKVLRGF